MHDLLLAKHGIATAATHPLRVAVTRHQARLRAELTKARLRRGFASIEDLRQSVNHLASSAPNFQESAATGSACVLDDAPQRWSHPRWVRINTLRTSLDVELETTFKAYARVDSIEQILRENDGRKLYYVDQNIPDLLALPSSSDIAKTLGFQNGLLILQDKASCFPAYLLNPMLDDGAIVDACAAPGNKTTHLAALLHKEKSQPKGMIWACERDQARALTLKSMIDKAGAHEIVNVKAGQDFLQINPQESPWSSVKSLLLDPSCSGSGIVGRDDVLVIALPTRPIGGPLRSKRSTKRKRTSNAEQESTTDDLKAENSETLSNRLSALSDFQLRVLLHAFSFPAARKITYSTCSLHAIENEHVVLKALNSPIASQRGWRILQREEQVPGARAWLLRGDLDACRGVGLDERGWADVSDGTLAAVAEACIRCEKGTREGTQGFFVAGFVRDGRLSERDGADMEKMKSQQVTKTRPTATDDPVRREIESGSDQEEWEGFSDE